ncbi:hypothetical protein [Flavobacterium sp. H122]|uniref:hypothetical protein n=1 Tax=Flavobacterium sp. H122 TaxID=2529860 RepID=UPI0010AB1363|nr:hypothetical protein [Flavobacterium sp. H122]
MSKRTIDFTKSILERVSFDAILFAKELQKAVKGLLPYELEELTKWFFDFTQGKPELRKCAIYLNV